MRKILILTVAAIAVAGTAKATPLQICPIVPAENWMTTGKAEQIVRSQGYKVFYVQPDGGCWTALAEMDGSRWEVYVHPATGEVVRVQYRQNQAIIPSTR